MARPQTIVLVEGRKPAENRLGSVLSRAGYRPVTAGTKKAALAQIEAARPLLVIVDVPSLRFSWPRFAAAFERARFGVPLLALLPEGEKPGNNPRALAYPFSTTKLTKRIAELLADVIQVGEVIFNVKEAVLAYRRDQPPLTPKQAQLLEIFMRHPGQVLTRAFLMKQVWETDYVGDTQTLTVHVRWLRKRIERDPQSPQYLRTVRGVGYRFAAPTGDG